MSLSQEESLVILMNKINYYLDEMHVLSPIVWTLTPNKAKIQ